MAESIFKKHQLDITVDVELNDAQRKATGVKIKNMANEWQGLLDDAIKQGIEQGARSASLKDVLTQFNAQLKAFKLEPLAITVGELEIMDKPIEHAAKMVIQKIGDSFKGGGLGNIISEEITDSLNVLGGTVDKIYQKMEQGAKKSASNIAKSMREIEEAASRYTKKGDMSKLDSVLRVGVTSGKAQKNVKDVYEKSVSTSQSDASWDQKYAADVAFVRNYKALDEKMRQEVFGEQLAEVEAYYKKLATVHQDKMTALNNILAQNDYVGAKKSKHPMKYQLKGIEPWAQEKTLQEVKNILSGGLTVKGDNSGSSDDGKTPDGRNTKVPPVDSGDIEAAEQAKKTEEERLRLVEKRRIEQEKIAEMLKKEAAATPDTSAFNQKLFDAIEKFSNDTESAFKSMMNGDIDEDQFDDRLSELRGEFLKQFKFDNKQRIDDYLAEKSDNMGEWDSKKIYDRLSKKLSPEDPSWPRIKESIVDGADQDVVNAEELARAAEKKRIEDETAAEAQKKAADESERELRAKEAIVEAVKEEVTIQAQGSLDKEKFAYLNTDAGKVSSYIEGGYEGVSKSAQKELLDSIGGDWDSTIHTHPELVAAPSEEDIQNFANNWSEFKKNFILAGKQLAEIDFSGMTQEQVQQLSTSYKQNILDTEDGRSERLSNTPLKELGVELLDVESVFGRMSEQLKTQFPNLITSIDKYIENIRTMLSQPNVTDLSQNDLEDNISDLVGTNFKNSDRDTKTDIYQMTKYLVDGVTGIPAMYQQEIQGIFKQTIESLHLDPSKIFKIHNADAFFEQMRQGAASPNTTTPANDNNIRASIDTEELRGLLNSITYNVKVIQDVEPTEGNKVSINADELRSVLDSITYNVKLAQGETDGESNKIAIDEGILENVLNRITYDVKIAHDDADKTANKIAIDESALEQTLNRVFGNILTPKDDGKKPEPKKEPWALEKTLNTTIKGILDQIQTNTAKVDAPSDTTGASEATTKLVEIKSILESINAKIVKGGVIATRGAVKQAGAQAVEPDVKRQAARSNMMKSIINDYKTMGKLAAQFASDGNLETKAMLENLKEEIRRKRSSLNITMQENANLREKYSIAFEAEKRLLEAEEQQRKINEQNKADAKVEKKKLADAKKLAQREAMVGKAGNAVGRAENTWMNAVGMEDVLPKEFDAQLDDYYQKLDALRKKQAELKNSDTISEEQKADLIAQTNNVNKLTEEIGGLIAEYQRLSGDNVDPTTIRTSTIQPNANMDTYEQQLKNYVREITNGKGQIKGFNAETQTLTYTVKTGAHEFTTYTAAVRHLDDSLVSVRGATKKTETFLEATARKMKEISSYMSGMALISRVGQELRRGIQYVREIDLALTELKKVTDETEAEYDQFLQTAAKTGARLGTTISAVTEATSTFAKLGYSMEQAREMAESAIVYKNVGDNIASTEDAADSIISTLKGFGLEVTDTMKIVDSFNEVGNRFAITSQGIGEALRLSASALNEGGNSLHESIGLITAANEVVNDPSSVGTALKTLTLRLRGSKTELEEMGEDVSDMATTTSQLQAKLLALTGGQVDIMLDENTFKNSAQILREMAGAWEDMTDIQRASALELMGGKRQANVLSALIQNFNTVEKVIETSANSAGSALEENERYLDSIQGKIDQFNNAMQAMWSNTLNSDMVKGIVSLGTELIKIIDKIGLLNIAIVGLVTFLEAKHGVFSNLFKPADDNSEVLKQQLEKAERDLAKATQADMQGGNKKTAQNRRDAEERVAILKTKIQESSSEAILDGIDESFDPSKIKKQMGGKKGAIAKRAKKLEGEGKTFAQIQEDPKIKQWTEEIKEGEQALDAYNAKVTQADMALKQKNITTKQADAANKEKTASTWADVWAEMTRTGATSASVAETFKQVLVTKLINSALVQKGLAIMGVTIAEGANIPVTTLLSAGFVGLASSIWSAITAMWTFMTTTPIGWILLAVAAVVALGAAFSAIHKSSAELREELSGLKDEISDIKDEIDSLNSELETTRERMAELLAKDHLTFTEQEELENLQKQNDLLEREIYLLEQKEKRLQAQAQRTFDDLMGKEMANTKRDLDNDGEKDDVFDRSLERRIKQYKNRIEAHEEAKNELVQAERELETARESGDESAVRQAEREVERKEKKVERKEKRRNKKKGQIDGELAQYLEDAEGIDYESADPETRAYLDYINNTVGKVSILEGDAKAKSMEIKRIFNQTDMAGASKEIDALVEKLKQNPGDENIIAQISEQCKLAEGDLNAVGLSLQDAVEYFTMGGSSSSDYIMQQYGTAVKALNDLKSGAINLNDLVVYDSESGEATADITAIAEKLKGVSPEVRDQFSAIVEDIKEGAYDTKEGLVDWDSAIKKLELQGMQAVIANVKTELESANKLAFPDLEVSGWIDSVEELSSAFESLSSAMDLIVTAQEQMNSSGRISMKTALDLMATTDDWNQILEVNNGVITMNANAEQILIQSKLDLIKANIEMALQEVETQIALSEGAINSTKAGNAFTNGFTKALTNAQGVLVGLKAGWDAFWAGSDVSAAFNSAYKQTVDNLTPSQTALDDLYQQRDELNKKLSMIGSVDTTQEFKNNYDFDKTPGDKYKDDSGEDDAFQRAMDYWENRIAANQARYEQLQNEIDLLEKKGQKADASYYQEQIKLENERLSLLEQQKAEAQSFLGTFVEGSEEWWEIANTLNDIEGELDSVTQSIVDLQDAISEIDTYKFEEFGTRLDNLISKLDTIRNLIAPDGEEDWFDENGDWTEAGVAVLGSQVQALEMYKQGYQETMDELAKYKSPYEGNESNYETLGIHSEQEYYDKTEELISQQYDFAESISDTEQSIVDMYESNIDAVEEYINTLIDGYNDYIDSVKEALDAERDCTL